MNKKNIMFGVSVLTVILFALIAYPKNFQAATGKVDISIAAFLDNSSKNPLLNPEIKESIMQNKYTVSGLTSNMLPNEIESTLKDHNINYTKRIYGNVQQVQRFIGDNEVFDYTYFAGGGSNTLAINFSNMNESDFVKMYPEAVKYEGIYSTTYVIRELHVTVAFSNSFFKSSNSIEFKNF